MFIVLKEETSEKLVHASPWEAMCTHPVEIQTELLLENQQALRRGAVTPSLRAACALGKEGHSSKSNRMSFQGLCSYCHVRACTGLRSPVSASLLSSRSAKGSTKTEQGGTSAPAGPPIQIEPVGICPPIVTDPLYNGSPFE